MDEPWDSPHNLKLAETIPPTYRSLDDVGPGPRTTRMLAPLTDGSVFGRRGSPVTFADVSDGVSNSVWLIEAPPEQSVIWTKPEDLIVDEEVPGQSMLAQEGEGVWVGMMDGSVKFIDRATATDERLSALLTIAGGEVVEW